MNGFAEINQELVRLVYEWEPILSRQAFQAPFERNS